MILKLHISLTFFLFALVQSLNAQADSTWHLKVIEVTGTRFNRFGIGQTLIEIDSSVLSQYANQSMSDMLSQTTPLSIKSYGAGLATISLRGTNANHTALLWNGFDIRSSLNGLSDLSILPNTFEKMTIKSGGCSALFGCGAIGGAIYLDNDIRQKQGFHGQTSISGGSFGLFGQQIDMSVGNNRLAASVKIVHQHSDNDFLFRNTAEIGKPIQRQQNAAFEKASILSSFYLKINEKQVLKANVWGLYTEHQIPNTMTERNDSALQHERSNRFSTEWARYNGRHITKIRAAYFDDNLLYKSDVIDSSKNAAKNVVLEAEHNIDFLNWGSLRVGVNRTEQTAAASNFNSNKKRQRIAVFASQALDFRTGKLSVNVRQEMTDGQLVPFTFSMGAEKRWTEGVILRGAFSKNYNLPTLNDLYWQYSGNPDLRAEKSWSEEIGADFLTKKSAFGMTIFNMNVSDWIQWTPQNNGLWRPTNLKKVWSRGIETKVKSDFAVKKVAIKIQMAYQLSLATDNFAPNYQLLYTPVHSANGNIEATWQQFSVVWLQNYSSRRPMTTDGTSYTKGFTVSNVHFFMNQKIGRYYGGWGFKVQNLWNVDYQTIRFYSSPRRNFLCNIIFKY